MKFLYHEKFRKNDFICISSFISFMAESMLRFPALFEEYAVPSIQLRAPFVRLISALSSYK
jgi:hypothetical protein